MKSLSFSIVLAVCIPLGLPQVAQASDQTCTDPALPVGWAHDKLQDYFFAEFDQLHAEAIEAFGCSDPADPVLVARMMLLKAWRVSADKGSDAVDDYLPYLLAARALAPDLWLEGPAPEVQERWEAGGDPGMGTVSLQGLPKGFGLIVNGAPFKGSELPATAHILQVVDKGGDVVWARMFRVQVEQETALIFPAELRPGKAGGSPAVAGTAPVSSSGPRTGLLVTGLVVGASGGGAVGGTYAVARNTQEQSGAGTALKVGNTAGWGMILAGAALSTVAVLPRGTSVSVGPGSMVVQGQFK